MLRVLQFHLLFHAAIGLALGLIAHVVVVIFVVEFPQPFFCFWKSCSSQFLGGFGFLCVLLSGPVCFDLGVLRNWGGLPDMQRGSFLVSEVVRCSSHSIVPRVDRIVENWWSLEQQFLHIFQKSGNDLEIQH